MSLPFLFTPSNPSSPTYPFPTLTPSPHPDPSPDQAAKEVVLAQKPVITDDTGALDPLLLDKLLRQIATLASIYHKPPEMFVSRQRLAVQRAADLEVGQKGGSVRDWSAGIWAGPQTWRWEGYDGVTWVGQQAEAGGEKGRDLEVGGSRGGGVGTGRRIAVDFEVGGEGPSVRGW